MRINQALHPYISPCHKPGSPGFLGGFLGGYKSERGCKLLTTSALQPLFAVRGGFEPPVQLPVRQFSKLVVSATHPSHQNCLSHLTGLQI